MASAAKAPARAVVSHRVRKKTGTAAAAITTSFRYLIAEYAEAVVGSHHAVARAVADGVADLGVGLRAVARAECGFVPLADARFDFIIPNHHLDHPAIKVLLDVMQSASLRADLAALPGYDVSETGAARMRVAAAS